jgi:hypothetical protein
MHARSSLATAALAAAVLFTVDRPAGAIPVHPHGPEWTSSERDGDKGVGRVDHRHPAPAGSENGDSAHQHYIAPAPNTPFPGPAGGAGTQPFNVFGAWLERRAYIDVDAPFTDDGEYNASRVGHSFIEWTERPRYRFVDADMPQAARKRVAEAFRLWGGIRAHESPVTGKTLRTGIGFEQTAGNNFEIEVRWRDIADNANGGCVHVRDATPCGSLLAADDGFQNRVFVEFDSTTAAGVDFDWDFTAAAALSDLGKFHFLSVALHELGHLMFLLHSPTRDTDLMNPPVGLPLGANVGDTSYRWDSYLNNPGENDSFQGLRFTRLADGIGNANVADRDSPDGIKSLYSIPIPQPATLPLVGLGVAALGWLVRRGKGRCLRAKRVM